MKKIILVIIALVFILIITLQDNKDLDKWPNRIKITQEYEEFIKKTDTIIVRSGTTGKTLKFEQESDVLKILNGLDEIVLNKHMIQKDSTGWMYSIKCYDNDDIWNYFELTIGGSIIEDSYRGRSPYYKIKNYASIINILDDYFNFKEEVYVNEEIRKRNIDRVVVHSGFNGEIREYKENEEIEEIVNILKRDKLKFIDYSSDHEKGCNIYIEIFTNEGILNLVYGGGNFPWRYSNDFQPLTPYYISTMEQDILIDLLEYTGLNGDN